MELLPSPDRPTLRYAGSFKALGKLPPEGAIIEVPPGTYTDRYQVRTNGVVTIRALDPVDSLRPKFFGSFSLNRPRPSDPEGFGTLTLEGLELTSPTVEPGMDGVGVVDGARLVVNRCYIHGFRNGIMGSHVRPGKRTEVEIRDCEITMCGQGDNLHHNVYMSRVSQFIFEGNSSHSCRGGHALKYIARDARVRNNRFLTTDHPTRPDVYWGTTLIDGVACGTSIVTGNHLERWAMPGNKYLFDVRRRKSICGADTPWSPYKLNADGWPYDLGGSKVPNTVLGIAIPDPRYWDEGWWWENAAPGMAHENAALFQHYLARNTFIDHDAPAAPDGIGVWNQGTAPVELTPGGEDAPVLMEPPEGWIERAVVWASGNTFEGPFGTEYDSTLAPVVDLGDDPPAWFRTVVAESTP